MLLDWLTCSPEVQDAFERHLPVVALESTLISHGLPWPQNLETARRAEASVRTAGAIPATIAVIEGRPTIGLTDTQLMSLAENPNVQKASRRDLAYSVAMKQTASTTVSATMALAYAVGIRTFATGGIGGAHPRMDETKPLDISADLTELSRTPVLVVCAGAKSILDVPQTLELLETFGVPVIGYQTNDFPAFYVRGSGGPVSCRVSTAREAAEVFAAHLQMGGRGALLVQAVDEEVAVPRELFQTAMQTAEQDADQQGISGPKRTPYLLSRLAELTVGQTLQANQSLIVANARLAAETARHLTRPRNGQYSR